MKKILITLALLVATTILLAQAPQKFSYQGVIRDAAGNLVRNVPVGVRVSLLKASAEGVAVYCETHRQSTNANGLLTLTIGDGTVVGGDMAAIDWADGPYFLKTETDITGGSNYTLVGAQQLLSVPYALYAGSTTNGFSGDYNDLSNKPEIPEVPTEVSAFTNDAGYISNKECDNLTYCQLVSQLAKLQNTVDSLKEKVQEGGGYANDSLHSAKIEQLVLPIVNTLRMDSQSRYVDAELLFHGRSTITECGICYGVTSNPTLADVVIKSENKTIGKIYTCRMGYLNPDTEYYVRAYASNSDGTAYGTVIKFKTSIYGVDSFPCPGTPTLVDYDGNTYNTVQIGSQCWMKENLKTTTYADGTSISTNGITSTSTAYYYYPNGNSSNKETYGLLYNWKAVTKGLSSAGTPSGIQGVCPMGWHVPSDAEWEILSKHVRSQSYYTFKSSIGKSLCSQEEWGINTLVGQDTNNNNATGFSILPAGWYYENFLEFGNCGKFWSAKEGTVYYLLSRKEKDAIIWSGEDGRPPYGCSVRCLKDL